MQYGCFDDSAREYVVTRPDTPRPWANYLGSTEYGAIVTNHAGGYSFYKSAAQGRFLRLRFNAVPADMPGRLFYLRDRDSGDYWSAAWQPVAKPLDAFKSTCRHGTAYTVIESQYEGIETESTYFVPLGQDFEYWMLKVTNTGSAPRRLSVFTYAEFANHWNTHQDLVNLQYTQYITRTTWHAPLLEVSNNGSLAHNPDDFQHGDQGRWSWMALVGADVTGFDFDRTGFLGDYGTYAAPRAVVEGKTTQSHAYGDNACGGMKVDLDLAPGQSTTLLVLLGVGKASLAGKAALAEFGSVERAKAELSKVREFWHARLGRLVVQTPDSELDSSVNVWNAYNCLITFAWSRAASLVYNGERDGLGYRDTVQDILGVLPAIPDEARERLELMITGQCSTGGAMPVVKPFAHRPGHEAPTDPEEYRSDDCLWLFNTVPAYVAETGDLDFYHKVLPYADQGQATVLGHLRRAMEFNLERTGANGLPCGLAADWNDCLKLGYHGESLFVAFQLRYGLVEYAAICTRLGLPDEAAWALSELQKLDAAIQKTCWDGEWFIWAIGEDGTVYGRKSSDEGQIYLNTQVWSILSGAASPEQAKSCMDATHARLATPNGVMLTDPPFENIAVDVMRAVLFNPGTKENGSIFNHTQGWVVMADCLLGDGDRAYGVLRSYLPAAFNQRAEVRGVEPYVHCQSTHGIRSPKAGAGRLPWLTGAATWTQFAMTQYLLGIRPEIDGLRIDPCIPRAWPGFEAERVFRGCRVHIEVRNIGGVCRGVRSMKIDGAPAEGNLIPVSQLRDGMRVEVELG